ncbi:helix-turn-helix domain-containing protein [Nocardioides sp. SYSU DS0651]|uniref:helix-turn-helix domain-containing protein n=1 Tax=Nocardioides sp. SYSU DS0651 TaxID=3415955 RepID=UPI003F4C298D
MPRGSTLSHGEVLGRALGRLVADARRQRRLSQEAVARSAGISIETLRKLEQGKRTGPDLFTVAGIARSLDLSLDLLLARVYEVTADDASAPDASSVDD